MKRVFKLAGLMAVVIFVAFAVLTLVGHVAMRKETRNHLYPVLSASVWSMSEPSPAGPFGEDRYYDVLKNQTQAGDEAAVILLDYYLGEHNYEELTINLTQRGRRVLPYLLKYENKSAFPLRPDFLLMRLSREDRERRYKDVIGMIREGKVLQD